MTIVLHAFIDESYIKDRAYILAAVVVTPSQLRRLTMGLDDVIWKTHQAHGSSTDLELHGQQLFQRSADWRFLAGRPALAHAIYTNALRKICQSEARVFFRGVKTDRLIRRYKTPFPPHEIVLQHLLEQLDDYALAQKERIQVIADEVEDQAHHEARMRQFQLGGTPGFKSSKLERIDMPFQWEPSHRHRGLQAADLAAYVYRRKSFHVEKDPRTKAAVQGLRDVLVQNLEHEKIWSP